MTQEELNQELDNADAYYYESGAYYDTDLEKYREQISEFFEIHHRICLIEF